MFRTGLRRSLWLAQAAALAVFGTSLMGNSALAQTFPDRAITIVVGFAPGGGADLVAREVARRLQDQLKRPVVVDNRPGAGGTVSARMVATSRPDGYTLLLGTAAIFAIAPQLYKGLPYDANKAFAPIATVASNSQVILVKDSLPINGPQQLISYLRENPGKVFYGTAGNGSTTHLLGVQFARAAQVSIRHVPYRGLSAALTDLAAGNVDMMFDGVPSHVGRGLPPHVRAIATTGPERAAGFANLPTLSEAGLPGFSSQTWYGLFSPASVPAEIRAQLNQAVNRVLAEPAYRASMEAKGYRVIGGSAEALGQLVKTDSDSYADLIQREHVTID